VIQLAENVLLVPRIMKISMGVNPIIILLSLVTFSSVFGFPGALLALPLAAIIQLILERIVRSARDSEQESESGKMDIQTLLQTSNATLQAITEPSYADGPAIQPRASEHVRAELSAIAHELNSLLNKIQSEEDKEE